MLRPYPTFPSNVPHFLERVNTYCARVLPLVFDNSLSYYEFLGHMQHKLNEVINALNSQNLVFVEFTHMIELEMQNFESYIEERQQNFETDMQQEWDTFKADMQQEWADFKGEMQQAWADEQALNAQFRTDMQQAFTNFQTVITTQQTAFETALRNQQNQFQSDLTSRQNTFEDTMEGNFEQWKVDTLTALQAGIQQFEQDALAAIRAELPDMIEAAIPETIAPAIEQEVRRQDFAKIVSASDVSSGTQLNISSMLFDVFDGSTLRDSDLSISDLANITINPNTSIVFTGGRPNSIYDKAALMRVLYSASFLPASGYTLSVGLYKPEGSVLTEFDETKYTESAHATITNGSDNYLSDVINEVFWNGADLQNYYYTVRFLAAAGTAAFTCDYSNGIQAFVGYTADLTIQDTLSGYKYRIPKKPDHIIQTVSYSQTIAAGTANNATFTVPLLQPLKVYRLYLARTTVNETTGMLTPVTMYSVDPPYSIPCFDQATNSIIGSITIESYTDSDITIKLHCNSTLSKKVDFVLFFVNHIV